MDNEPREQQTIHLLELVISHHQSAHEQNVKIMGDIVSS